MKQKLITRDDFGDAWPFLYVNQGMIQGHKGGAVTFKAIDTYKGVIVYAVNGLARSWMNEFGWREVQDIWAYRGDDPLMRKDLGPVIDMGLELADADG